MLIRNCIEIYIFEDNIYLTSNMIPRFLQQELLSAAQNMPIISLTGPRQSGKTTLARNTFPSFSYQNLEIPEKKMQATKDPRSFLEDHTKKGIIIDEAQLVPELFSWIQAIVDDNKKAKFIITGSQNFLISKKINQSLAGRVRILNLLPLSIQELRGESYDHVTSSPFILKGGYPRIYDSSIPPQKWFPDYIQTYLERDVRDFANIKNLTKFQLFMQLCATRIGQVFNHTNIANAVGVSDNTIKGWLSILEASYILYRIPPYYKNLGKRLVKSPKIFFYDTGLACSLLNITNEPQLLSHYLYGSLFENFIVSEVLKMYTNRGQRPRLYYWRESNGIEIDLLIEQGANLIPIEVKSSKTIRQDFFNNINKIKRLPRASYLTEGYVVYGGCVSSKNTVSWRDCIRHISRDLFWHPPAPQSLPKQRSPPTWCNNPTTRHNVKGRGS